MAKKDKKLRLREPKSEDVAFHDPPPEADPEQAEVIVRRPTVEVAEAHTIKIEETPPKAAPQSGPVTIHLPVRADGFRVVDSTGTFIALVFAGNKDLRAKRAQWIAEAMNK